MFNFDQDEICINGSVVHAVGTAIPDQLPFPIVRKATATKPKETTEMETPAVSTAVAPPPKESSAAVSSSSIPKPTIEKSKIEKQTAAPSKPLVGVRASFSGLVGR